MCNLTNYFVDRPQKGTKANIYNHKHKQGAVTIRNREQIDSSHQRQPYIFRYTHISKSINEIDVKNRAFDFPNVNIKISYVSKKQIRFSSQKKTYTYVENYASSKQSSHATFRKCTALEKNFHATHKFPNMHV